MPKAKEVVPLDRVKTHLHISAIQTAEDPYLETLIAVAGRSVERHTGRTLFVTHPDDAITPADFDMIGQAMLLMIGHWYAHREAVSAEAVKEVPMAVTYLLEPLYSWAN